MRYDRYREYKFKEVSSKIAQHVFQLTPPPAYQEGNSNINYADEIIQQLKEKFAEAVTYEQKYVILTALPKSWSARKIEREFNVSFHIANRAKKLQEEKGVLSTPNLKLGSHSLDEETIELVQQFYEDDDISRVCPGKRDFIITLKDGEKIIKQRRLVLCNLKEAYQIFKQKYPTIKIGFSRFSTHRPGNCILANSSGTHSVCVCIYHENMKLMFHVLKSNKLLPDSTLTYRDLISQIICENSSSLCVLQQCENCPGTDHIHTTLLKVFDEDVEMITFKQWQQVDRCSIENIQMEVQQFVEVFCEKLSKLVPHHFIAQEQAKYLKHCKGNLKMNECIVISDFSENYSFVVQDAIQGFHWANAQCTIHPFAIYYKDENNEQQFTSLIAIAESLKHNHVAVRLFLEKCYELIKEKFPHIKK